MRQFLTKLIALLILLPALSFAKKDEAYTADEFNKIIDEGSSSEKTFRQKMERNINSAKEITFEAEVISLGRKYRNPIKYNVFIAEDEVR